MATALQLKTLANERILEAEVLLENSKHAGVFYLAGYAIEFALKAVICSRLDVEMFDQSRNSNQKDISPKVSSAFLTHNLTDLLILSGLKREFNIKKISDSGFAAAWSEVSQWSEQRRYDFGCTEQAANDFLSHSKTLLAWIRNHW
ncbi:hypothetical protein MUK70_10055 [Dyadobacter chenwenxiniae]|uniref:HEPN domain-containing protein n=1 Tax=Dyadobacter chenwenxiniae TaxID=2906456 RepID=A0A9X1PKW6_9BACT|nr:hypothetical protein [Dyadobacter chenwenxiniae]MCF0063292.1 hypothetical protein [Dyadobacter chenwenxiniae]UON85328.1 hypothetical protein MUK70_10055 [Dyadobacter chenwenxiniae]